MNLKTVLVALIAGAWIVPVYAATSTTNGTTIAASSEISPGRYVASVYPNINATMAGRLEKTVADVQGVGPVTSNVDASTIRFTINNGYHVHEAEIQKAVANADRGAVMSAPILEHSEATSLGL